MCGEESCGVDSSRVLWRRKAEGGEGWESGQPRSCGGAGGSELGHGDTGGHGGAGPVGTGGCVDSVCPVCVSPSVALSVAPPRLPWFANKVFEAFVSTALGLAATHNVRGGTQIRGKRCGAWPWGCHGQTADVRRDAFAALALTR